MSVLHPHFSFPEDCLPIEAAVWWRDNSDLFLRCLTSVKYRRPVYGTSSSGNLLIYPPKCDIKEEILNGRKPKQSGGGLGTGNNKSAAFQWINVSLTAEDVDTLSKEQADLEQLSLAYIAVGGLGFGLSVKYDSAGKSYTVCIYGPDMANDGRPCGVSGRSSDLRDAILVCLFKFNNRLQGSFDGVSNQDATVQSRRFQ